MGTSEELRDLADKIDKLARNHSVWSVVYPEVQVLCDHIMVKARVHEVHEEPQGKGPLIESSGLYVPQNSLLGKKP